MGWQPFLPHVRHRGDLNVLIAELIGEIACGHQYVSGGELPDRPDGASALFRYTMDIRAIDPELKTDIGTQIDLDGAAEIEVAEASQRVA